MGVAYGTAYRGLFQRASQAAETVLVHGASGGVGTRRCNWRERRHDCDRNRGSEDGISW